MKPIVTNGAEFLGWFRNWFAEFGATAYARAERIGLDELRGWHTDRRTGNLHHDSGKFFTIEGLAVRAPGSPVPQWEQPIINQPEVGILGILVKRFGGVPHCLMQAKVEPGNTNGLQLSPTVQATRSNYTGVHGGRAVPYVEYFRNSARHRVLADVRQSEQGAWFHGKRNRNMVLEVTEGVPLRDGFCWLTIPQIHALLAQVDVVNMDARTVLSCFPAAHTEESSLHSMTEILSWLTEVRTHTDLRATRKPLSGVRDWARTPDRIAHRTGRFFDVIGVRVTAGGREVSEWTQPMIAPGGTGVIAFLVRRIGGVLHALVHAKAEPGCHDVAELAPTVQCTPQNYAVLPAAARPPFLDEVLAAGPDQIRFSTLLSEEGGRFFHARNRYLIVETSGPVEHGRPDYRWLTLSQLSKLLQHSHYLNVEARSLVACLRSLL